MALSDLITTTIYTDKIPSSKEPIKFRPFVVKEERALMMAQESGNNDTMIATLEKVVRSCVTNGNLYNLSTFDVEYLFVKIRCKSIEEFSSLIFTCNKCQEKNTVSINLTNVTVHGLENTNTLIKLDNDLSVELKYPGISDLLDIKDEAEAISKCIKTVYRGDESHDVSDLKSEEIVDFLDNLSSKQYEKIEAFYANVPYAKIDADWKCTKCETDHTYELKGINDFF
jgi:hypothetical protein